MLGVVVGVDAAAGWGAALAVAETGEAEVDQPHCAVGRDEHVARVDVAVDDAQLVQLRVRLGDATAERQQRGVRVGAAAGERCGAVDQHAVEPLQRQPRGAVARALGEQPRRDAAVEVAQHRRLATEHVVAEARTAPGGARALSRGVVGAPAVRARALELERGAAAVVVERQLVQLAVLQHPQAAHDAPAGDRVADRQQRLDRRRLLAPGRDEEALAAAAPHRRVEPRERLVGVESAAVAEAHDRVHDGRRRAELLQQRRERGVDQRRGGAAVGPRDDEPVLAELFPHAGRQLGDGRDREAGESSSLSCGAVMPPQRARRRRAARRAPVGRGRRGRRCGRRRRRATAARARTRAGACARAGRAGRRRAARPAVG